MTLSRSALPIAVLVLLLVAVGRIVATYGVFVQTYDEGAHIAVGMQWLDLGTYEYEPQHPPMRAVYAIGPYLLGLRSQGEENFWEEGNKILYAEDRYERNLAAARLGAIPFFAGLALLVWEWAHRLAGRVAGLAAVLFLTTLPVVLAHSSIATTDILLAATFTGAIVAFVSWLETPTLGRSILLGTAIALTALSKFSAFLFLAASFGALGASWLLFAIRKGVSMRREIATRMSPKKVGPIVAVLFIVVWAGYRFSLGPISPVEERPHEAIDNIVGVSGKLHDLAYFLLEMPIPAPELPRGLEQARSHLAEGHTTFFLGEIRDHGWRSYFPIVIAVKSTIPLLLLALGGGVLCLRRAWVQDDWRWTAPVLVPMALLAVCIPVTINIGVRHVLPVFAALAVLAGIATAALIDKTVSGNKAFGLLAAGLLAWHLAASVRAHPDYLAYFNECCDDHPEAVLVDSDLDWGQDLKRLAEELRRRGVDRLHLKYFGKADPAKHGLPQFDVLEPYGEVTGWVAISQHHVTLGTRSPPYDQFRWLTRHVPVARVGKTIWLYHIPGGPAQRGHEANAVGGTGPVSGATSTSN
jgi:hypothetical protein